MSRMQKPVQPRIIDVAKRVSLALAGFRIPREIDSGSSARKLLIKSAQVGKVPEMVSRVKPIRRAGDAPRDFVPPCGVSAGAITKAP